MHGRWYCLAARYKATSERELPRPLHLTLAQTRTHTFRPQQPPLPLPSSVSSHGPGHGQRAVDADDPVLLLLGLHGLPSVAATGCAPEPRALPAARPRGRRRRPRRRPARVERAAPAAGAGEQEHLQHQRLQGARRGHLQVRRRQLRQELRRRPLAPALRRWLPRAVAAAVEPAPR